MAGQDIWNSFSLTVAKRAELVRKCPEVFSGGLLGRTTAGPSAPFPLVTSLRMTNLFSWLAGAKAGPSASFPLVASLRMTVLFCWPASATAGPLRLRSVQACGFVPFGRFAQDDG